ncbi:DMT family transporter [Phaeodactylibacter luteus]|uniref:EamA family transporter n=1 Tax=Phaeodactylibacter luteus TaxID=1564516 RepID=A0A5C6S0L2_9BACT|nr:EamA family transporter [Phaeodactylibacter luteus]TXB67937.1 EamA family transporter [Phaeodactylibacter luteus]
MQAEKRAYLELHIAVFLFGFTAILGDLIQLSALVMVWWRVLITSFSLLFLIRAGKALRKMPRPLLYRFMGIGVIVALHWVAFYGAIKLSNASITLICMATTSFFTSLLEPFIMKQRIRWYEMLLGLVIIPGMALIVNSTEATMNTGILVGLLSAFLAAFFATLNKKYIGQTDELTTTFVELGSAWLFLCLVLPAYIWQSATPVQILPLSGMDWFYLVVLSLLCTTLAYVLALRALRHLTAFASNLTVNLEPVYGIALAWLLLNENEELAPGFYAGVGIILLAVFSYPLIRRWRRKRGLPT